MSRRCTFVYCELTLLRSVDGFHVSRGCRRSGSSSESALCASVSGFQPSQALLTYLGCFCDLTEPSYRSPNLLRSSEAPPHAWLTQVAPPSRPTTRTLRWHSFLVHIEAPARVALLDLRPEMPLMPLSTSGPPHSGTNLASGQHHHDQPVLDERSPPVSRLDSDSGPVSLYHR